ncbi:uncharacterized protein PAC_06115 [Phialocephala subalpina]|uniref:Uncharacterized protein n=1 Tax=Phialocephala subalpina TaxID=576137 RepID=A0A1L7WTW4_9HELO|nr:uncharacterized protein PAC_06115 [Phialocephala subalpina]
MDELPQYVADEYEPTIDLSWRGRPEPLSALQISVQEQFHFEIDRFALDWDVGQEFFRILDDLLCPQSVVEPQSAAAAIAELYSSTLRRILDGTTDCCEEEDLPGSFCYNFFYSLFFIAKQLPAKDEQLQEKLVDFLAFLRKIPTTSRAKVEWRDLPRLPWAASDIKNDIWISDAEDERKRIEELNFHAFIARQTVRAKITGVGTSDAIWGLQILSGALENEPDPRSKAYQTQGPMLDETIPLAAQWIKLCGEQIFEIDKYIGSYAAGGRKWKGKQGFCLERWQFWRRRFSEISEFEQASDETRRVCKETARLMEEIERA